MLRSVRRGVRSLPQHPVRPRRTAVPPTLRLVTVADQMPPTLSVTRFWAKLSAESWHPLSAHLADVAAVAERLIAPGTALSARLARALDDGSDLGSAARCATVALAFLHDIGKVQHGFQRRRDPAAVIEPSWRGHVRPLLDSAGRVAPLTARLRSLAALVGGTDALWTAICHHGRPHLATPRTGNPAPYWEPDDQRDPLREFDRLLDFAMRFSGLADEAQERYWPTPALHLLAGVVTLADWLGSSSRFFPFTPEADLDPPQYWERARAQAEAACDHVGLAPRLVHLARGGAALAQLFPETFPHHAPTVFQKYVAEMALPDPGTRLLVESDTGSGKTEAALTLFGRLRAAGLVDALFFALPTRATASAMLARVARVVDTLYVEVERPGVALALGGRQQGESTNRATPLHGVQYPDEGDPALIARWTSQSARHAMAAEVVVGTVDQALLAALAARHAHLRLAGLSRALIVVDEVHAYDRYMTTVLRHLTDLHTSLGGIVLFMSATLASDTRTALGARQAREAGPPSMASSIARPYPSLSVLSEHDGHWRETHLPASNGRTRNVRWRLLPEQDALDQAITAAGQGARVLILRNTVRDARAAHAFLTAKGAADRLWRPLAGRPEAIYHSRYTRADRGLLDAAMVRDFGKDSTARGVMVVATQVAEQSLDIDFDLLVSDLAPIDVLIQRLGRVHRHEQADRAGIDAPSAVVIEPGVPFSTLVDVRRRSSGFGHGTVYADLGDLELTRRLIVERAGVTLPAESRTLIESVYHPEVRAALAAESVGWAQHLEGKDGDELAYVTHAEVCVIRFDQAYTSRENVTRFGSQTQNGGANEAAIRTRIGDDRVRIELPEAVRNAFAVDEPGDRHVDLDARVLLRAGIRGDDLERLQPTAWTRHHEGGTSFRLGPLFLRYDPLGWQWATRQPGS